ncbi:MAG: glycosyltransferase family 2 protein [Okeania sp. SIO2G4]|uniref:glycosyltransferase family 2 protein n=1 Tax=unclassified Okeania TaxID=2634635 RepID=UPI0013B9B752|nr:MULTISPECIES: glycosyltransferase family A protein [unclassified Okeania]NEP72062.1 glycosyltransferase family 2 protein [Okeania sp. SIO2G5]NEP92918.1 glycosyltransferase family 2 protein [Okeania sp. SIO2F5]NEQ94115.1 glycosyltransferase family 2 protein [Okeania sp. SIO2G4]
MSFNNPLISVIVPAYNAEEYLEEALQSISKQNYEPLEIIVIDDGSTDKTASIAKGFSDKINYIYQENSGPAAARNTGIKIAQGEYIAFLDSDDIWGDNHLEILLNYLTQEPDLEAAMGRVQCMVVKENQQGKKIFEEFGEATINVNLGAGIYKKSVFIKQGYFDPNLQQSEDVDWFMRNKEAGIKIAMLEETTLYYRLHQDNISRDRKRGYSTFLNALKKSLDRRRNQNTQLPG